MNVCQKYAIDLRSQNVSTLGLRSAENQGWLIERLAYLCVLLASVTAALCSLSKECAHGAADLHSRAREFVHRSDIATQCAMCISLRDPRDRFAGKNSELCIFPLLPVAQRDLAIS